MSEAELELGLNFVDTQRASYLREELEASKELVNDTVDAPEKPATSAEGGSPDPRALAERRASMKAWVQYARALFSAAEFRFID